MRRALRPAAALVGLLACAGLTRLTLDGAAPWRLDPEHPVSLASARLNATTGGDDLIAVVLVDSRGGRAGLLDRDGVAALDAVRLALEGAAGLERVRSVLTAPIVSTDGGAVTAITPLHPPPQDDAGWAVARPVQIFCWRLLLNKSVPR